MRARVLRLLPVLLGAALLWPSRLPSRGGLDLQGFAGLPVLESGRVKPWDGAARTWLLMIHGRQALRADKQSLKAGEWLLEVLARPEAADLYRAFRVEDPDLLGLLGRGRKDRLISYVELEPRFDAIQAQAARASQVEAAKRTRFEAAVVALQDRLRLYQGLKSTLQVEGTRDLPGEVRRYRAAVAPGVAAVEAHMQGASFDREALQDLSEHFDRYRFLAEAARARPLPPGPEEEQKEWRSMGQALLEEMRGGEPHPAVLSYALMASAYRLGEAETFNGAVSSYSKWLREKHPSVFRRARAEALFDAVAPFLKGTVLYVAVFVLFLLSWAVRPQALRRAAGDLLWLAFAVHTAGLAARMLLQGRPPVTNLYSSAVFVGWVAAGMGLVLERRYRNTFGGLAASAAGFATLVIAHNLAGMGDTLEVMRAVLDSNFWLSTHVVTITMGYGTMFLASALAHVWLARNFRRERRAAEDRHLVSMTYGTVCAALFFSFVGTILGGIWADQSWGRFWGWDPKENGALLIVLWCAVVLHARWGGYIRERGLMLTAVFGGIITSLSWFGVNMLGIGLHSYGFMDKAFWALSGFVLSQLLVMALGSLPAARRPA